MKKRVLKISYFMLSVLLLVSIAVLVISSLVLLGAVSTSDYYVVELSSIAPNSVDRTMFISFGISSFTTGIIFLDIFLRRKIEYVYRKCCYVNSKHSM